MPREADFWKLIGRWVKVKRKKQGMTQENLAGVLGLTRTSVTNIEAGRQKISAYKLHQLEGFFGGDHEYKKWNDYIRKRREDNL